ncbi:Proteasome/cyclosome repeat family protein [Histomonas meleagridis]|uniref:Proteasome/cyclosome repeat family protein n=1 Tax=Histomonas meleagridis TaxID=135588 RepID=UPI003559C859|nr:Proteasome/cyclosome repeat family protein [Histomonas meleagridis]KAH0798300.1 Proteasome/cyclosome repeat family protein [Histomonas meleagridis]
MWGTAQGLLAFLEESDEAFQAHGLRELLKVVSSEWPQIAEEIQTIEKLALDESFKDRYLAAELASRVYYFKNDLSKAVEFAMISPSLLDPSNNDTYTQKLISYAIGECVDIVNNGKEAQKSLSSIVDNVLKHLISTQKYGQALCIAIETRSLESVKEALHNSPSLVNEAITLTNERVANTEYRSTLLRLFVEFATNNCDKLILSQLHLSLHDPESTALLIQTLKQSESTDNLLIAYQIAFELADNASQKFRSEIINKLPPEMTDIRDILQRKKLLDLYLQFLFKNSNKDTIQIIEGIKESTDQTTKLIHTSTILSYAYMFAGTGDDDFFRKNVEWFFGTESDWAEFTTIAAIGTIHNGRLDSALQILGSYLRRGVANHSLGGALYALGLIYANYLWDKKIVDVITENIRSTSSFVVKHGGALGLGLVAMGSQDNEYYTLLNEILHQEDPIAGEAAGYALGLIMLGRGESEELLNLYNFIENTPHEKITRGGAMGLAFMMYGLQDSSEALVQQLLSSRIPLLRESAAWVTSLAYVGTSSNIALQRLLHLAVSDVNSDVRRASIIGIGFVLSKNPKRVPEMIDLLAKSYNPSVRNGAALALGISCAGTGMKEAINILKPLLTDLDKFVRQSAIIAMAMVLQQQSDTLIPYCKEFREFLRKKLTKRTSEVELFGVNMAYGIMNASNRNVIISCNTLDGENNITATVGLAMFTNYFYWHPLSLMLTLSFQPTAIIGVDKNLEIADWTYFCSGKPSLYANPPTFNEEKPVVTLADKKKLSISDKNENEESEEEKKKKEEEEQLKKKKKEEEEEEMEFQELPNLSRVTLNQLPSINLEFNFQYVPIVNKVHHGVIMLKGTEEEQ